MSKLSKAQVSEIQRLHEEGKTCIELALIYGVKQPTITYWTNPKARQNRIDHAVITWKNLNPDKKKVLSLKKKEYLRKYMSNRYKNDEEFRLKHLEKQKTYQNNKKLNLKKMGVANEIKN